MSTHNDLSKPSGTDELVQIAHALQTLVNPRPAERVTFVIDMQKQAHPSQARAAQKLIRQNRKLIVRLTDARNDQRQIALEVLMRWRDMADQWSDMQARWPELGRRVNRSVIRSDGRRQAWTSLVGPERG